MKCIKDNLKFTRLESKAATITADVMNALYRLEGEKIFDIIFMDPPYGKGLAKEALGYLKNSSILTEDTMIIVEESLEFDPETLSEDGFEVRRVKTYKSNQHIFIRKKPASAPAEDE